MVDSDTIAFNIAAFLSGLFVLEFGADKFIDHTAKVANRLNIPPTLIALLTAGAEWEELIVVVAAISQSQSSLALGNIVGSSISNILGAFSLGLIFYPGNVTFDRSSKIYTALLLALTSFLVLFIAFLEPLGRLGGLVLVLFFIIYVPSIAWAVYKGIVVAPEDSDSDDDAESNDSACGSDSSDEESGFKHQWNGSSVKLHKRSERGSSHDPNLNEESVPLAPEIFDEAIAETSQSEVVIQRKDPHSTMYHLAYLTFGLLALSLSGYILSHSISALADSFSLSGTVLGITVLSFATTLPEKLVAIISGSREESGIMIANTVGSNIFLVTLCAGILFLAGDLEMLKETVTSFDLVVMLLSSLLLFGIVMIGGRKWMGWVLFGLYIAFIFLEFTISRP